MVLSMHVEVDSQMGLLCDGSVLLLEGHQGPGVLLALGSKGIQLSLFGSSCLSGLPRQPAHIKASSEYTVCAVDLTNRLSDILLIAVKPKSVQGSCWPCKMV